MQRGTSLWWSLMVTKVMRFAIFSFDQPLNSDVLHIPISYNHNIWVIIAKDKETYKMTTNTIIIREIWVSQLLFGRFLSNRIFFCHHNSRLLKSMIYLLWRTSSSVKHTRPCKNVLGSKSIASSYFFLPPIGCPMSLPLSFTPKRTENSTY